MLLVRLCFVLVFDVGQLLALYFSLVVHFILISIGCSGALLLSLAFEMEIKYMYMMIMTIPMAVSWSLR